MRGNPGGLFLDDSLSYLTDKGMYSYIGLYTVQSLGGYFYVDDIISYNSAEEEFVGTLRRELTSAGIEIWGLEIEEESYSYQSLLYPPEKFCFDISSRMKELVDKKVSITGIAKGVEILLLAIEESLEPVPNPEFLERKAVEAQLEAQAGDIRFIGEMAGEPKQIMPIGE